MQLHPLIRHRLNVVQGAGTAGMPGDLQSLSWGQAMKNLASELGRPSFQLLDLIRHIHIIFLCQFANLDDARF